MLSLNKALDKKYSRGKHKYKYMSRAYLQSLDVWKSWNDSITSSMLVLSGLTAPKARAQPTTHSWLSPAAIFTVEDIHQNEGRVAFYCCHSVSRVDYDEDHHYRGIVASLIYQIVQQNHPILKEKGAQIDSLLSRPEWLSECKAVDCTASNQVIEKATVDIWFKPLKEALVEASKSGFVHIVLDRIELARGCALKRFMAGLSGLVHEEKLLVKIFVVIDAAGAVWDGSQIAVDNKVMVLEKLDQRT
jgi:hypothetical protein